MKRQGVVDGFLVLFGLYPWECESCQQKMYSRRRDARSMKEHPQKKAD